MAAYEYIFIWDEDLGVDHFNAEEYASTLQFSRQFFLDMRTDVYILVLDYRHIKLVNKDGLIIS